MKCNRELKLAMNKIALIENQISFNGALSSCFLNEKNIPDLHAKNDPFLSYVSDEASAALMGKAKTITYPKQTLIISEGDETSSFFIILSGKVRVFSVDNKCREFTLNFQGPGTCFGEIALLTDVQGSVSIVSIEKTVCAAIKKRDFINWLANYPDAAFAFLVALSEKIRQLTDKVRQLALSNVYERTVNTLQEMAVAGGDVGVIRHRLTQQELASMVGASREMVNKVMQELTKGGYVSIENNALIINRKLPSSW
jgi:CRP/FNR family cyclic AMP-dependent transcriptional regulator